MEKDEVIKVIITNRAESRAVELTYCRMQKPVPFVSKKSKRYAYKIIRNGKRENIPKIFDNVLIILLFNLKIGEMIPRYLFQDVAEVLAGCR